ncbi:tachykinin-like peptides receptor 99D, partial [Leptotrombidium deliense]
MEEKKAIFIIGVIWVCGSLLSLPNALYSKAFTYSYAEGELRTICFLVWPDGSPGYSTYDYIYNITFLILTYVLPMGSMAFTYTFMARVLWGSKAIGEGSHLQREFIRSKQKVVKMLIVVVVLFAFCWAPYHGYFLYTYHFPDVVNQKYVQHVYLAIYWLAMSNSMYNPIIYVWMNKRYDLSVVLIEHCWLFCTVTFFCENLRKNLINTLQSINLKF